MNKVKIHSILDGLVVKAKSFKKDVDQKEERGLEEAKYRFLKGYLESLFSLLDGDVSYPCSLYLDKEDKCYTCEFAKAHQICMLYGSDYDLVMRLFTALESALDAYFAVDEKEITEARKQTLKTLKEVVNELGEVL